MEIVGADFRFFMPHMQHTMNHLKIEQYLREKIFIPRRNIYADFVIFVILKQLYASWDP